MKSIYFLVAILLMSCSSIEEPNKEPETPQQTNQPIKDTIVVEEDSWDEDEVLSRNRKELAQLMKTKNFEYTCVEDCKAGSASHQEVKSHRGKAFYEFDKVVSDSSIYLEYKFIQDCCKEFGGDYSIENDTIKLTHYQINMVACECWCSYEYAFVLPNNEWDNHVVTINGEVLE